MDEFLKKCRWMYTVAVAVLRWVYPRPILEGTENIPQEGAVLVGNHCQMHGPIISELFFSQNCTWCIGHMMHFKEVPSYAFKDFWWQKPKYIRWFYRILSYIIAPVSVAVFNNARTIGVYRDNRILDTFRETVASLQKGEKVVIFPEHNKEYNNIICDFQNRFVDIAKLYYKKTGKELSFVPVYMAPMLKKVFFGKPVRYCGENQPEDERQRICDYLMKEITGIACAQPLHRVVPYNNVRKKEYPLNIDTKTEDKITV